jgi:hypothetical protein
MIISILLPFLSLFEVILELLLSLFSLSSILRSGLFSYDFSFYFISCSAFADIFFTQLNVSSFLFLAVAEAFRQL